MKDILEHFCMCNLKQRKTDCGPHCSVLIWRFGWPQENRMCLNNSVHTAKKNAANLSEKCGMQETGTIHAN